MASLGDLDRRMHEERWGDSFEGGSGTYLGRRKWADSSHSLTQQVNHSLFVRSSEGGEVVGGVLFQFHFPDEGGMALLSWRRLCLNIATADVSSR